MGNLERQVYTNGANEWYGFTVYKTAVISTMTSLPGCDIDGKGSTIFYDNTERTV